MIIEHEVEINWKDGKKKIKVSFDLPVPSNASKDELIKEYGDEVLTDYSTEQMTIIVYGGVVAQLSYYLAAAMSSEYAGNYAIPLLQDAISDASDKFRMIIEARQKMEEMN